MDDLVAFADRVVSLALQDEQLEAFVSHAVTTTIQSDDRVGLRSLHHSEVRGLGVRVIRDAKMGYASTSDLSPAAITGAVRQARDNAAAAEADEAQVLPRPAEGDPAERFVDLRWHRTTLDEKTAFAREIAYRVVAADPRLRSVDTCEVRDELVSTVVSSSTGVHTRDEHGHVVAYCDAVAADEHGRSSDFGFQLARRYEDLDADRLVADTVERNLRMLGRPVNPRPGLPLIFDPVVIADLLNVAGRGLAGGPMSSGRSPFANQIGSAVASSMVTLIDSGRLPTAPSAALYDDEGQPTRRTTVIRSGIFETPMHSTVTAAAMGDGMVSTGNARRSSYRSAPRAAANALLLTPTPAAGRISDEFPEGIYVQELTGAGSGINRLTGEINVGASGWFWRDGIPAGRVESRPISTSLTRFLHSIIVVEDDARHVPMTSVLGSTMVCSPDVLDWG